MKPYISYSLAFVLAVALIPATTFSQQVNDKPADEALRQKAYKSLESLAEQLGSLKSAENRARIGSNIAGSLWPHNEAKARQVFAIVAKEIKEGLAYDGDDPDRYVARPNFVKLREDSALRIAKFDPEWSVQFLKDTIPTGIKIDDDEKRELDLLLAVAFAGRNPDLALKLGRETVNGGVRDTQLGLIYHLNKKSRVHASALFGELVKVVPYQSIRSIMKNEQFYFMLARMVEPTLGRDPAFRDLMTYFTDVALEAGCGKKKYSDSDGFCYRLGLVVPLMEKVDAKRVAPMKHLARRAWFPYESSPEIFEYADVYENGSVDDLIAMVPKYPEFREFGEGAVIRKVMEAGEFERARKLVNESSWKPESKQEALKHLDQEQRIANEDTSAEILKEAEALGDEGQAFAYLFRRATEIGITNRQTTQKLLDRANELLPKVLSGRQLVQYEIGIAARYCQVKSNRCFTTIEPVVRKMNELVSAATELEGFDNSYLRKGEWNMTAEGGVGSLLTMLSQNAVHFALFDFDRSMALTSQFERPEIRMMAQLKLAQGVLDGPPKKRLFYQQE
jgi:hypothetical protein